MVKESILTLPLACGINRTYDDNPQWWKNYITFINQVEDDMIHDFELNLKFVNHTRGEIIDYYLREDYAAWIKSSKTEPDIEPYTMYVVFTDLNCYMLFMLRFG